jgi:hypothetical protein
MTNPHVGSSLNDFLAEEGILEEVEAVAIKRTWRARSARR